MRKTKQKNNLPKLDSSYLKSRNFEREQLLTGLSHLSFANKLECERVARSNLAYELATMELVYAHYKIDSNPSREIADNLIYRSIDEIELAVNYSKLPVELKEYLIKVVGGKPFELFKTLELNKLTRAH